VPLSWNGRVVGVINVQTRASRQFTSAEMEFLVTIAALLGGIIEKGRLQAEQEAQLESLTALDVARAELLSLVTHELRTPLSVVRAYLDLLGDAAQGIGDPPPRASAEAWRDAAVEQVTRLDGLVDSILVAVRGQGLEPSKPQPFDADAAIQETLTSLAPLLRSYPLRFERSSGPVWGVGDEARFKQVLEHLLENESKYAPPGQGVSLGAWVINGEVQVYVTDDGPGIPREDWESVFEPFVRIDRRRPRGSGIGLFAARRLMQAMGGRVWLEANGYGGSRFMLALPAGAGWSVGAPGAASVAGTPAAAVDGPIRVSA
jgi:signal transduction histidine kinase